MFHVCKVSASRLLRHTQTFRSENAIEFIRIAEAPPELAVATCLRLQRYGDFFIPTIPLTRYLHTTFMVF